MESLLSVLRQRDRDAGGRAGAGRTAACGTIGWGEWQTGRSVGARARTRAGTPEGAATDQRTSRWPISSRRWSRCSRPGPCVTPTGTSPTSRWCSPTRPPTRCSACPTGPSSVTGCTTSSPNRPCPVGSTCAVPSSTPASSGWTSSTSARPTGCRCSRPPSSASATASSRQHDVTDRNHFGAAVDAAPIGMAIVALDSTFLAVNTALCALTGRTAEWLREHRTGDVLHAEDRHLEVEARERALEEAQPQRVEVRVERADGSRTWVEQSIAVLDDATGPRRRVPRRFVDGAGTWVVQYVDVDDDHAERERLNYQATHDALTRVGNRHTLVQRVDELLRRQPRTGEQVGILFVDVDHLKRINDEFGHAAGDGALVALAERIRSVLRADDEITRFGGDEFVVILPGVHGADDAQRIARSILDAMREPVIVGGRAMVVSVSIGVTVAEPGDTPGDVFAHADAALYRAKRSGRARAATYHPLVDEIIDLTDEDDPGT
ncbi:MAG: diguanylate cyclase [Acidimicrobiia bacterium]